MNALYIEHAKENRLIKCSQFMN